MPTIFYAIFALRKEKKYDIRNTNFNFVEEGYKKAEKT